MPTPKSVGMLSYPLTWGPQSEKHCACMLSLSVVSDSCDPMYRVAHYTPQAMGFPRQEYGSGPPFPPPGDLPNPGIKATYSAAPALASKFFTTEPPGKPLENTDLDKLVFSSFACHIIVVVFLWAVSSLSGCVHIYKSNYSRLVHPAYPTSANIMGGGEEWLSHPSSTKERKDWKRKTTKN